MRARSQPVVFVWSELDVCVEGGVVERVKAMVPSSRYSRVASKQFTLDAEYPLEIVQYRSMASHNQYFAAVSDAFDNLPEKLAPSFPSDTHLRKWALIQCGHFKQKETEWDTRHDAMRHATYVRTKEVYSRINVEKVPRVIEDGAERWVVIVREPLSQDFASMSKAEFEQSKRDVLELLESIINVPKGALMKNAGRSA